MIVNIIMAKIHKKETVTESPAPVAEPVAPPEEDEPEVGSVGAD